MSSVSQSQKSIGEVRPKSISFENLLEEQGYLVYTATGYSMMPLLRQKKDLIEIRPLTTLPKKYDVYLYKRGDRYILHRCISISPYIFAGDHNTFMEYGVTDDMIIGIMTRVIRDGKTITPDNTLYKLYYHLWVDFYPIRVFLLKSKVFIRRLFRAIKHKKLTIANIKKYLSERH